MIRCNAFGQRLGDDAPELPGDFEVDSVLGCEVYLDVQSERESAGPLYFFLLHENDYGVRLVIEVGEYFSGQWQVMRWTDEEWRVPLFKKVEYLPLEATPVDMTGFSYRVQTYRQQEKEIIQPQLEALGYTGVQFRDGERDSFGPLTRVVITDQGKLIYG